MSLKTIYAYSRAKKDEFKDKVIFPLGKGLKAGFRTGNLTEGISAYNFYKKEVAKVYKNRAAIKKDVQKIVDVEETIIDGKSVLVYGFNIEVIAILESEKEFNKNLDKADGANSETSSEKKAETGSKTPVEITERTIVLFSKFSAIGVLHWTLTPAGTMFLRLSNEAIKKKQITAVAITIDQTTQAVTMVPVTLDQGQSTTLSTAVRAFGSRPLDTAYTAEVQISYNDLLLGSPSKISGELTGRVKEFSL